MIYNKDGEALDAVYGADGSALSEAYDIDGTQVYSSGIPLKFMTYNVGQWYTGGVILPPAKKSDYYTIHTTAFNHAADICFLQEATDTWCTDGSLTADLLVPYFEYIEDTRTDVPYKGHYMCSKEIQILNYAEHSFTQHGTNYPGFESAQIVVGGKTINLINTHNDYSYNTQYAELDELMDFIEGMDYFILAGDFNIDLSTQDTSSRYYKSNVKRFLDAGYNVANCSFAWIPTYFSTPSPTGGKYTDQIVTSPNIEITDLYAETIKLTDLVEDNIDHIPLIAELMIR